MTQRQRREEMGNAMPSEDSYDRSKNQESHAAVEAWESEGGAPCLRPRAGTRSVLRGTGSTPGERSVP